MGRVALCPAVARSGALCRAQPKGVEKQPEHKRSRRVTPRLPACPATCRFLLDQGCRRLEVTLRDSETAPALEQAWRSPGEERARLCPRRAQR